MNNNNAIPNKLLATFNKHNNTSTNTKISPNSYEPIINAIIQYKNGRKTKLKLSPFWQVFNINNNWPPLPKEIAPHIFKHIEEHAPSNSLKDMLDFSASYDDMVNKISAYLK